MIGFVLPCLGRMINAINHRWIMSRKNDRLSSHLASISGLPFCPEAILEKSPHESEALAGWLGLATWIVVDKNGDKWDLDWRYAFGAEIFKQHLIDFGWNENKLLYRKKKYPSRHKAIIYICVPYMEIPDNYTGLTVTNKNNYSEIERNSGFLENPLWHSIPESYLLGIYWQSIHRGLLPLAKFPQELHQLLPNILPTASDNLFGDFSTTRNFQKTPPEIISNPEEEVQTVLSLPFHPLRKGEGGLRTKGYFKHPENNGKHLISVITVVFDNVTLLEQTMQSVINQSSDRIEYIVIDGGSTDGTLELIRHYDEQIDYWVSESDEGLYYAMNKALTLAVGRWVYFINSDDLIYGILPSILGNAVSYDAICYATINIGKYYNWKRPNYTSKSINDYSHQSVIYKNKYLFDTSYRYIADAVLLTKYINVLFIEEGSLACFRLDGVSSSYTISQYRELYSEYGISRLVRSLMKGIFIKMNLERLSENLVMVKQLVSKWL
jgi:hypothetical protein